MDRVSKITDQEQSLKLLDAIESDSNFTQRELSKRVSLSLGKINFLLSALIKSGYVKAKRFKNSKNKSAYLYILTPLGMKEKAIMANKFLEIKIQEYNRLKKEIAALKKVASK